MAVYYASKAYVLSFTEALRGELAPQRRARHRRCARDRCRPNFRRAPVFEPGFDSAVLNVSAADVARQAIAG